MDLFTRKDLNELLKPRERPCVSLFMPTHRGGAEQDPIRFRKLLTQAHDRLVAEGFRPPAARDFIAPLQPLVEDATFWANQSDGLAVFLAHDFQRIFRVPLALQDEVEVGGLFQVAPLLPLLHGDGRFFVLALSQNSVRLYQGTRFTVHPVDLKRAPKNLAEALRTHDRDEYLTFHSRPTSGGTWGAIFEGHGVGIDTKKDDLRLYFKQIDKGVHEVLREERAPLIVAGVEYLLPLYREVNTYPHLLEKGIVGSADRFSEKELHDRVWAIVEPHFQESLRHAVDLYHQAAATGKANSDTRRIVPAAYRGEIATVFVALGTHVWGVLDAAANNVDLHEQQQPGDEDLMNFTAIHALRHGHTVYAVRPDGMPLVGSALAAIGHLPLPKHGKRP